MSDAASGGAKAGPARLTAVVVTCNRLSELRTTIARLLAEPVDRIVVVDNASGDGTREWLAAQAGADARLDLVLNAENLGGAGGFAAGIARAGGDDPDWIVVMDDDGRPAPGAITAFRARAAMPGRDWDAVAAAVRYPNGRICDMNRPWINPFWSGRFFLRTLAGGVRAMHVGDAAYDGAAPPTAVDCASFVGLFLSRRAARLGGLPDPRLFIYGDDGLYTLGLRRAGLRLCLDPAVAFEHDCKTYDPDAPRVYRPLWKVYYYHRNAMLIYRMAAGPAFWALAPLLWLKWRRVAAHQAASERARFRALLSLAFRDGATGRIDRPHAEIVARAEAD